MSSTLTPPGSRGGSRRPANRDRPQQQPPPRPPRGPRPAPRPAAPPNLLLGAGLAVHDVLAKALQRARTRRRLTMLLAGYLLLVVLMGYRLVNVQIVAADQYTTLAERQTQREVPLPATRGAITDRDGAPLALSVAAATVYANPRLLGEAGVDPFLVASQLIEPMSEAPPPFEPPTVQEIVDLLATDREFVYIGRQLPRAVGEAITALELPGVGVFSEPTRVYPAGHIASQVIGWAGLDNVGLAGLERQYNAELAGEAGTLRMERAPGGLEISAAPREVIPDIPGVDLRLTIDREVQFATEEILIDAVEQYDAIGGSAVVLDVDTGELLAMASVPSVAPPSYATADPYDRTNRTLEEVFEPGSVNKVITIAGALEDGLIGPEQVFSVPGQIYVRPHTFNDSTRHGTESWTTRQIMARSSNVGTIQIAQLMGQTRLHSYVTDFGLGSRTGLGFPGESPGILADLPDWNNASLPTIAIGQGVSATLVQVAQVFGVIANDGELIPPSVLQGTIQPDGSFEQADRAEPRQVVSAETARTVADMLVDVVEQPYGTGSRAAVDGYRVGGKTGTAQKTIEGVAGYAEGRYIATFAGFAPAEDPQIVVAVMLDEPTPHYGGLTAAPTFSQIMDFALRDQRVAPNADRRPLPAGARLGGRYAIPAPLVTEEAPAAGVTTSGSEHLEDAAEEASPGDDGNDEGSPVEDDSG